MSESFYHLFKYWYKKKDGTKYFYWWYWWYDPDTGRQMNKPAGRAQTVKKNALEYIESLPSPSGKKDTVRAIAEHMFTTGSPFLQRREARGSGMATGTLRAYSGFVKNHIIPRWGDTPLSHIDGADIEDWLMEVDLKNSTRNSIIDCFNMIFAEAKRGKKLRNIPVIERFSRDSARYDTFRDDELKLLFPASRQSLVTLYRVKEDPDPDRYGLMFAVMLLTAVSGGLRSGEVRALTRDQVFINQSGIVISRSLDSDNKPVLPKKGKDDNPKYRAVLLPDRTIQALSWWLEMAPPSGMFFKYQGAPVDRSLLL